MSILLGIPFGKKSSPGSGSIIFAVEIGGETEVDGGLTIVWAIMVLYVDIIDGRYELYKSNRETEVSTTNNINIII